MYTSIYIKFCIILYMYIHVWYTVCINVCTHCVHIVYMYILYTHTYIHTYMHVYTLYMHAYIHVHTYNVHNTSQGVLISAPPVNTLCLRLDRQGQQWPAWVEVVACGEVSHNYWVLIVRDVHVGLLTWPATFLWTWYKIERVKRLEKDIQQLGPFSVRVVLELPSERPLAGTCPILIDLWT